LGLNKETPGDRETAGSWRSGGEDHFHSERAAPSLRPRGVILTCLTA
jgi:hypothetical protein